MTCTTCKGELEERSKFCSRCGAPVAGPGTGPFAPQRRQIEAMLAEANLLRMRAQWVDAESRCIDVIHLDANNVHSHSLLGDIYRDQGKLEEAGQWYQMALDLNPDSPADRAKLAHVEREREKRDAHRAVVPSAGGPVLGTQKLMGIISPHLALRSLTVVAVVFGLLVVALVLASRRNLEGAGKARLPGSGATSGLASNAAIYGSPVPTVVSKGPILASRSNAGRTEPATQVRPSAERLQSQKLTGYTGQETTLRNLVNRQLGVESDASVDAVTIDTHTQQVNLVMTYFGRDPATDSLRQELPQIALKALQSIFSADQTLLHASVNMRANLGSGLPEPAFGGDAERSGAMSPQNANAPPVSCFVYSWWAPALTDSSSAPEMPSTNSGIN
jgi:hypothetical protein